MQLDKNALDVFVTVAETRNFRLAAEKLGVTRPAVSQALRRLEERLNIALMRRTTRSISLTEAGERLYAEVAPAIAQLNRAVVDITELSGEPRGQLRLAVSSIAERIMNGELLASFIGQFPHIELDITITDDEFDIVAQGYDAGVRLGEIIAQDMIAVPVSSPQRQIAVAAPAYLARYGTPQHPNELIHHRCIGWRKMPGLSPYRWEFADQGREFDVAVNPQLTTNDMRVMIRTACAGEALPLVWKKPSGLILIVVNLCLYWIAGYRPLRVFTSTFPAESNLRQSFGR